MKTEISVYRKLAMLEDRLDHIDMEHVSINMANNPEMLDDILSQTNRLKMFDMLMNA